MMLQPIFVLVLITLLSTPGGAQPMTVLRTPDSRFQNLPGYAFQPNYIDVPTFVTGSLQSIRMHYVDEGPRDSPDTILLLHGEPSWSYLYRHMIPPLTNAGHRVVAPDFIGFGKSDKPAAISDYTTERHLRWTTEFIERLDLQNVTLYIQDWGGLIGLYLITVPHISSRINRVVMSNTGLPRGRGDPAMNFEQRPQFRRWQLFAATTPIFDAGDIINNGNLPSEVVAAYNAPFPDASYQAGARAFPANVPTSPKDPHAAENAVAFELLREFTKPVLTIFGSLDGIFFGTEALYQTVIPGAQGQNHEIFDAYHFIQETHGVQLAQRMLQFMSINEKS